MSSMISLPLFEYDIARRTFDAVLDYIAAVDSTLQSDVDSWRMHGDLDVRSGDKMQRRVRALASAIADVSVEKDSDLSAVADRLRWLEYDLSVAPFSVTQPVLLFDEDLLAFVPNLHIVIRLNDSGWSSLRYLLGVLLSEMHRSQGVSLDLVGRADQHGLLTVGADVRHLVMVTIDDILSGSSGRDFSPQSSRSQRYGIDEKTQFGNLRKLLDGSPEGR